jgi:antitoxin CptB
MGVIKPNSSRLEWRCHRGTKELDLLMQTWLRQEFDRSTDEDQQAFLELLDWPDNQLIHLLLGPMHSAHPRLKKLAQKMLTCFKESNF